MIEFKLFDSGKSEWDLELGKVVRNFKNGKEQTSERLGNEVLNFVTNFRIK